VPSLDEKDKACQAPLDSQSRTIFPSGKSTERAGGLLNISADMGLHPIPSS
tara:strand:- start:306 stop:458 length:153 start_codon:yes stop_codon:yes gene_type:complete